MNILFPRPKLNIPKTRSEKIGDVLGYGIFLITLLVMLYHWQQLPDQVALHFNAKGEADRWGGKAHILWIPFITMAVACGLHALEKHPECLNYPRRFNDHNTAAFYLLGRKLVNRVKNLTLIVFSIILLDLVCLAMQMQSPFQPWLWLVAMLGLVMIVGYALYQQTRIQ